MADGGGVDPKLLSLTNEHYSPSPIVEPARRLLGAFDLDPASCEEANKVVGATRIYTLADDGLIQPWEGRTFLNPPGCKLRKDKESGRWYPIGAKDGPGESSARIWWDKLAADWLSGAVPAAIFVGFNIEILRLSQQGPIPVQSFPRCYPKDRVKFRGKQPTHANVIAYLPPTDRNDAFEAFAAEFGELGLCEGGTNWWTLRKGAAT